MRVVAVSGGFDPMHVGHVEYFEKAKELGDELVVILNKDSFLMAKKGYVFMPFRQRKKILESLSCVDRVVDCIDEDMTVCKTLQNLKPAVFAKGGDRFSHEIPEKAVCDRLNIMIVDGLGDKVESSSELVRRSKEWQKYVQ